MAFADIPKIYLFKLIILLAIIIASFIIFNELLDIPFQESMIWNILCWGLINVIIVVLLFLSRDQKIANLKNRALLTNTIFFADIILNAICITFFIFVGSAYLTMFFAKTPFSENMTILKVECNPSLGGRYSPLPSFTTIRFINNDTKKKFTLTFRGNVCLEEPKIASALTGKHVKLSGRACFFGKYYDKIARQ